jgi:hypothetical protein
MVSLLDIAPASEELSVAGVTVAVSALSGRAIADIMRRFPTITMLIAGKADKIDPNSLFEIAPNAVAAVIAAGVGSLGDEKIEEHAATLSFDQQLLFLEAIFRVTMPGGLRPFAERLKRMGFRMPSSGTEESPSGKEADTT